MHYGFYGVSSDFSVSKEETFECTKKAKTIKRLKREHIYLKT